MPKETTPSAAEQAPTVRDVLEQCMLWHRGDKMRFSSHQAERDAWDAHKQLLDTALASQAASHSAPEPVATVALPAAEWGEMEYWLARCEQKGHLENCYDLVEPWEKLQAAIAKQSAPPAPLGAESKAGVAALPFAVMDDELAALHRFYETTEDGQDYDVPVPMMKRLAVIGLVRRVTGNRYEFTDFGLSVRNGDFDAVGASVQPVQASLSDTQRLDALRENSWDLRCIDVPTGGDDSDIHWRVVEHHMAEPHERDVGRCYSDEPRDAIDDALASSSPIPGGSAA